MYSINYHMKAPILASQPASAITLKPAIRPEAPHSNLFFVFFLMFLGFRVFGLGLIGFWVSGISPEIPQTLRPAKAKVHVDDQSGCCSLVYSLKAKEGSHRYSLDLCI